MFPPELRVTQISDEGPTPSFFIRFRDPVNVLTRNWNHVRSEEFYSAERIIAGASVLVVQRAFTVESWNHMQNARRAGKPIVYETDDLMLDLPPESGFTLSAQNASAIRQMLAAADLVTCSTRPLAERLSEYSSKVSVLENYAIPFDLEQIRSTRSGPPHVAIVNTDYFKLIREKGQLFNALKQAIRNWGYSVSFFGSIDPCMDELKNSCPEQVTVVSSFIPWRRRFLERLMNSRINVAIVPLEDNVHHAVKSDIKFLDFASIGVPGIYNNGRIYCRVEHQQTGFLCDGTYEGWLEGLEYFANPSTRDRCGDAAYRQGNQRTIKHYTDEFRKALLTVTPQSLWAQSMAAVS